MRFCAGLVLGGLLAVLLLMFVINALTKAVFRTRW